MQNLYVSETLWLNTMQNGPIMSVFSPYLDTLTLIRLLSAVCGTLRRRFASSHATTKYLEGTDAVLDMTSQDKRNAVKCGLNWRELFDFPSRLRRDFNMKFTTPTRGTH